MPIKDTKGGEVHEDGTGTFQLPPELKDKLDGLRSQGYTANGFIQALLERELNQAQVKKGA